MEIRIERRQTGQEILDEIHERWPDREAIMRDVKQDVKTDAWEAQEALFWWDRLQEDPARLEEIHTRGQTMIASDDTLRFLTKGRLQLLRHIADHRGESLGDVAHHMGKDLGNVQRATQKLADMGLVRMTKRKKETIVEPAGNTIRMDLLA